MIYKDKLAEYEKLPKETKKKYCFEDWLGANEYVMCEKCEDIFEHAELDELGHCYSCR